MPMGVRLGRPPLGRHSHRTTRAPRSSNCCDETNMRGVSQRREVTLLSANGCDIPIAFTAIRLGLNGPLLAVGRDLRAIAAIQQRFIESQQEMERDYWKRRQAEARYRLLFQVATDAVLVVDALTPRRARSQSRGRSPVRQRAVRAGGPQGAVPASRRWPRQAVHDLHHHGRRAGASRARSWSAPAGDGLRVSAVPFQADGVPLMLLRVRAADSAATKPTPASRVWSNWSNARRMRLPSPMPAGTSGLVNPAFLILCGLPADADLGGRALSEWVGMRFARRRRIARRRAPPGHGRARGDPPAQHDG
ncbi:MAG: hypothetical protein MZW92_69830 [Comamonadaceae bacterium]|nr:hypothetical protein [Comamonadaceae bacterium]